MIIIINLDDQSLCRSGLHEENKIGQRCCGGPVDASQCVRTTTHNDHPSHDHIQSGHMHATHNQLPPTSTRILIFDEDHT